MKQKIIRILDNVFIYITFNLIWNLGLWFLLSYGFFFSAGITKARLISFWSSSYHIAIGSIVVSLIGRWTTVQPKSYLSSPKPKNIFLKLLRVIQNIFWLLVDMFNFLFWFIFDSWRKPSVELFARMSINECTAAMVDTCNEEIVTAEIKNDSPITGYFGKSYFSLLKWSPTPYGRVAVIQSTILYGKMYDVKQGVFIRAWHRLPTTLLLFITFWFSGFTGFILKLSKIGIGLPQFTFVTFEIIVTISWLLFFMWISTMFAIKEKNDLNAFLKNIFSQ